MNDIVLNLIVLGGVVLLAGIIFFLVNQKQNQERKQIMQIVQQNDWQIEFIRERLAKGFRITHMDWRLEVIKQSSGRETGPGSSDMEQKTTWYSNQPGSTILIGPKTTQVNLGPSVDFLIRQVLQAALGKDADQIEEFHIGNTAFQKQYMVWAQDFDDAGKLLTPSIQSALMSWKKGSPLIKRTTSGLTIELKDQYLHKPDEIKALIHLGEELL